MKKNLTIFLQVVVALIGIGVLAFLIWQPTVEGRNVNSTLFETYFTDPFLAYVYASSILFFVALYQIFKILGYAGRNELFSPHSVRAVQTIKRCALILPVCIVGAGIYLFLNQPQNGQEDLAGPAMLGMIATFILLISAFIAAKFEKELRRTIG